MHKAVVHGYKRYGLTDYVFPAVEDASASVDGLKEEVEVNVFRDTDGSAEASLEKHCYMYGWTSISIYSTERNGTRRLLSQSTLMVITKWCLRACFLTIA
eukprot:jgi/Picre1/35741/NNA_003201.t1